MSGLGDAIHLVGQLLRLRSHFRCRHRHRCADKPSVPTLAAATALLFQKTSTLFGSPRLANAGPTRECMLMNTPVAFPVSPSSSGGITASHVPTDGFSWNLFFCGCFFGFGGRRLSHVPTDGLRWVGVGGGAGNCRMRRGIRFIQVPTEGFKYTGVSSLLEIVGDCRVFGSGAIHVPQDGRSRNGLVPNAGAAPARGVGFACLRGNFE
mmetsp:Transcript_83843/g.166366  ORF Transcript_83843/g.166366 Transcript_83843/m.166366 type:complete len:208 (-) Transcript_83843:701-1324(-)